MDESVARRMWRLYEPVHDVIYFAPEARAAAEGLGMLGFWMGYFAFRAAPIGAVGPAVATASFHGFHPDRAARALPEAWTRTTPVAALAARSTAAEAALRRLVGDRPAAEIEEAAEFAWQASRYADTEGRVLAAANQALPRPSTPLQTLWQATTTLREHRGDGHVAVLIAHHLTPPQAHLLKAAAGEADGEALRIERRWSEQAWHDAKDQLRAAGLLDEKDRLTTAGAARRAEVEAATDRAAQRPWQMLGESDTHRLAQLLAPLAAAVLDSGTLPMPNPVGITRGGGGAAGGNAVRPERVAKRVETNEAVARVLLIVAHPDDVDFGSGGTIANWTDAGIEVAYCIVTDGDAGGADPGVSRSDMASIRREEQRKAAAVLGVTDLEFLGYPDGRLTVTHELRRDISRAIRRVRPDRVVTQSPIRDLRSVYASHPDHTAAGEAALCAVYPDARNPFAHPELLAEGLAAHAVGEVWVMSPNDRADHYVDITHTFDRKLAALAAHVSQTGHLTGLADRMREWSGFQAKAGGLPEESLAEGYLILDTR